MNFYTLLFWQFHKKHYNTTTYKCDYTFFSNFAKKTYQLFIPFSADPEKLIYIVRLYNDSGSSQGSIPDSDDIHLPCPATGKAVNEKFFCDSIHYHYVS
jgi:hypothetical protein